MDNASFHKTLKTREIFDRSDCMLLYLPRYSPDLNPIERVFGFLKKRLRYAPPETTIDDIICSYGFT